MDYIDRLLEPISIITLASVIVLIITLILNNRKTGKIQKADVYLRLELASIELFRFEMEQSDKTWRLYNEHFKLAHEKNPKKAEREITNHITQLLNLFEMSIELHNRKIIDDEIFCTWLKWIFETAQLETFKCLWEKNLENHYTNSLRNLIEHFRNGKTIGEICKKKFLCKNKTRCAIRTLFGCSLEKCIKKIQ